MTALLDSAVAGYEAQSHRAALAVDRVAVCALLKGAILHQLHRTAEAEACLQWIIRNESRIVEERWGMCAVCVFWCWCRDTSGLRVLGALGRYTIPYAMFDIGTMSTGRKKASYIKQAAHFKVPRCMTCNAVWRCGWVA